MPRLKKEVRTKKILPPINNKKLTFLRLADHLSSFGFVISSAFYNVVIDCSIIMLLSTLKQAPLTTSVDGKERKRRRRRRKKDRDKIIIRC